jgi:hypothetical protein
MGVEIATVSEIAMEIAMRRALAALSAGLLIAGTVIILPATTRLYAQECTGTDCPPPGGHQCERSKEAPTA